MKTKILIRTEVISFVGFSCCYTLYNSMGHRSYNNMHQTRNYNFYFRRVRARIIYYEYIYIILARIFSRIYVLYLVVLKKMFTFGKYRSGNIYGPFVYLRVCIYRFHFRQTRRRGNENPVYDPMRYI